MHTSCFKGPVATWLSLNSNSLSSPLSCSLLSHVLHTVFSSLIWSITHRSILPLLQLLSLAHPWWLTCHLSASPIAGHTMEMWALLSIADQHSYLFESSSSYLDINTPSSLSDSHHTPRPGFHLCGYIIISIPLPLIKQISVQSFTESYKPHFTTLKCFPSSLLPTGNLLF